MKNLFKSFAIPEDILNLRANKTLRLIPLPQCRAKDTSQ